MKRLTLALLLLAACGSARPAVQVTPSEPLGAVETEPVLRTGASQPAALVCNGLPGTSDCQVPETRGGAPTPRPSGGLGDATSYFKPTPRPAGIVGLASWYDDGPGYYVALPGGDFRGHNAVICGLRPWNCITVPVRTSCICTGPPRKVADLSPDLFKQFAALSRGIVKVTVEVLP